MILKKNFSVNGDAQASGSAGYICDSDAKTITLNYDVAAVYAGFIPVSKNGQLIMPFNASILLSSGFVEGKEIEMESLSINITQVDKANQLAVAPFQGTIAGMQISGTAHFTIVGDYAELIAVESSIQNSPLGTIKLNLVGV